MRSGCSACCGPWIGRRSLADSDAAAVVATASELLQLEVVAEDRFRSLYNLDNYAGAIFGGQALGQALAAAQRTAPDWPAHSLSGYFLRGGAVDQPVDYAVERVNDTRRFAARRVLASQAGRPIFDLLCSFHDPEAGLEHQFALLCDPPAPESLLNVQAFARANADRLESLTVQLFTKPFPVELRLLEPEQIFFDKPNAPQRDFWFRIPSADAVERPQDHQALLAIMSDYWLAGAAGAPHLSANTRRGVSVASLNHSLWLHAPARTDDWLLYRTDSSWAAQGRGLARGLIYDRDGRLVATAMQEVLMRLR